MGFRFSIKWLLVAISYAAIAAAALTQSHWAYADVLWFATFLAFVYAVLLACFLRGPGQARAVGFAVVCAALAVCLLVAPDVVPTQRILQATGVGQEQIVFGGGSGRMGSGGIASGIVVPSTVNSYSGWTATTNLPSGGLAFTASPTPTTMISLTPDYALKLRSANALATMLAGLLGALLGALAYRHAKRTPQPASTAA